MKLILTEAEMAEAMMHGAPIPAGYTVTNVDFQKYSADFCTIRMERIDLVAAVQPAAPTIVELPLAEPEAA